MLPAEGRSRAVDRVNNDLISQSALLERTKLVYVEYIDDYDMDENCDDVKIVLAKTVIEAPAVDAVEVVRCGLCKHWDVEGLYCHHPAGLSYCGKAGAEKGFCCFGERGADRC